MDTLVVVDVDTLELKDVDVEMLVLALEYVEYTVVVGVLTLIEVEVDTLLEILVLIDVDALVVLDIEALELNEVDVDTLGLALEYVE